MGGHQGAAPPVVGAVQRLQPGGERHLGIHRDLPAAGQPDDHVGSNAVAVDATGMRADLGIEIAVLDHPGQFDDRAAAAPPPSGRGSAAPVAPRPGPGSGCPGRRTSGAALPPVHAGPRRRRPGPVRPRKPLLDAPQRVGRRRQQRGHLGTGAGRPTRCARRDDGRSAGRAPGRRRATGLRRAVRRMSIPDSMAAAPTVARATLSVGLASMPVRRPAGTPRREGADGPAQLVETGCTWGRGGQRPGSHHRVEHQAVGKTDQVGRSGSRVRCAQPAELDLGKGPDGLPGRQDSMQFRVGGQFQDQAKRATDSARRSPIIRSSRRRPRAPTVQAHRQAQLFFLTDRGASARATRHRSFSPGSLGRLHLSRQQCVPGPEVIGGRTGRQASN